MTATYLKSIRKTIALNVSRHLEAKPDIRIQALAEAVGVKRQYIYAIKAGNANVTVDKLEALAKALKTTTADLVEEPKRKKSA